MLNILQQELFQHHNSDIGLCLMEHTSTVKEKGRVLSGSVGDVAASSRWQPLQQQDVIKLTVWIWGVPSLI